MLNPAVLNLRGENPKRGRPLWSFQIGGLSRREESEIFPP